MGGQSRSDESPPEKQGFLSYKVLINTLKYESVQLVVRKLTLSAFLPNFLRVFPQHLAGAPSAYLRSKLLI